MRHNTWATGIMSCTNEKLQLSQLEERSEENVPRPNGKRHRALRATTTTFRLRTRREKKRETLNITLAQNMEIHQKNRTTAAHNLWANAKRSMNKITQNNPINIAANGYWLAKTPFIPLHVCWFLMLETKSRNSKSNSNYRLIANRHAHTASLY